MNKLSNDFWIGFRYNKVASVYSTNSWWDFLGMFNMHLSFEGFDYWYKVYQIMLMTGKLPDAARIKLRVYMEMYADRPMKEEIE